MEPCKELASGKAKGSKQPVSSREMPVNGLHVILSFQADSLSLRDYICPVLPARGKMIELDMGAV